MTWPYTDHHLPSVLTTGKPHILAIDASWDEVVFMSCTNNILIAISPRAMFTFIFTWLWTCKQWKSKNVWIWPRESLQGRGCTPPPSPTPHLGFTMQKKLVRQIEEPRGEMGKPWVMQQCSKPFQELFHRWFRIWWWFYRLSHVRSDWYIKTSKQPLNSITWQLIDRRMMYTYIIPLVPFIIILIFTAAI